ncbi:MAG TPA: ABC transporter permease [Acidimicrobiia bacterium]|nr:ABC transporter permease [Acidimicrobiia bacterium]
MSWLRFVGVRVAASGALLLVLLAAVFGLSVVLIPGDFATMYRLSMRAEDVELIRAEMGLDQSWWVQLGRWLSGVVRGDLGTSFGGADVFSVVAGVLPFTLLLLVFAVGAAFVVGVWLGRVAGWRPTRVGDGAMLGLSAVSTLFPPWLAFLLAYGTAELLGFGVFTRLRAFDQQLWRTSEIGPSTVAWMLLAGIALAVLIWAAATVAVRRATRRPDLRRAAGVILPLIGGTAGVWLAVSLAGRERLADLVGLMVLPVLAVALINLADTTLLVSTVTSSFRTAPFVFAARAKGLRERTISRRHVGRMILLPVISRYIASFPLVLGALVIVESAFRSNGADYNVGFPGLSAGIFGALSTSDIRLALGALLVVGVITVVARLILDVAHAALDPRYRDGTRNL